MRSPAKILGAAGKLADYAEMNLRRRTGRDIIHHFSWEATSNCNSRCVSCSMWQKKRDTREELSLQELDEFTQHPLLQGVRYVTVTGGEPFLRRDIAECCIKMYQNMGCTLGLDTNAIWDDKVVKDIHRIAETVPKDKISVAVAYNGPPHDWTRGTQGNAKKALRLMKTLRGEGFRVAANYIVLPENVDYIWPTYKTLKKHGIYLGVRPAYSAHRFGNEGQACTLSNVEKCSAAQQINWILRDRRQPYFGSAIKRVWESYLNNRPLRPATPCLGGIQSFYLSSIGNIMRCNYFGSRGQEFLGNIRLDDFHDIWKQKREICRNCQVIGWADGFYSWQAQNIFKGWLW